MELKQYNIEPTDENVLASLREDVTGRNAFLAPFLEIIDHSFVSTLALNGNWGSGKTFFIKQVMMLLQWADADSGLDAGFRGELDLLLKNEQSGLTAPALSGTYRTIYYNAWLYDDHNDPIRSLLYFYIPKHHLYQFFFTCIPHHNFANIFSITDNRTGISNFP